MIGTVYFRQGAFGVAIAVGLIVGGAQVVGPAQAQSQTEEEINRQVSRQISNAISRRVNAAIEVDPAVADPAKEDGGSSTWGNFAYNRIEDDGGPADFEVDVYQGIGAYDRRFGRFFVGASANVAYAETEASVSVGGLTASSDAESTSVGVNPYVAYLITDALYAKLVGGYSHTFIDDSDDSDSLSIEPSINYVRRIDDVQVKLGTGVRVSRALIKDVDDTTTLSYLVGGEVGVNIDNVKPFVRVDYEYVDPESEASGFDNNQLFVSGGVEVKLTETITLGVSGLAEVVNDDTNNYGGLITFRAILP